MNKKHQTPRHDKLLFDEACNFDVPWSEEYQKLERELVILKTTFDQNFQQYNVALAAKHDEIQSLRSERDKLQQEVSNLSSKLGTAEGALMGIELFWDVPDKLKEKINKVREIFNPTKSPLNDPS